MWRSSTSRPQGKATCRNCQRAQSKPKRQRAHPPGMCLGGCGTALGLDPEDRRWKYCSADCYQTVRNATRKASGSGWTRSQRSTTERGYGTEHQKLRKELLPKAYGQPCPLCGFTMEMGEALHLDHNEDRTGYRGMAHAKCNLRDGAQRARRRQHKEHKEPPILARRPKPKRIRPIGGVQVAFKVCPVCQVLHMERAAYCSPGCAVEWKRRYDRDRLRLRRLNNIPPVRREIAA
jgi:hypothetical protein